MTETPKPEKMTKTNPEPRPPVMWKIESVTKADQTINIWFPSSVDINNKTERIEDIKYHKQL